MMCVSFIDDRFGEVTFVKRFDFSHKGFNIMDLETSGDAEDALEQIGAEIENLTVLMRGGTPHTAKASAHRWLVAREASIRFRLKQLRIKERGQRAAIAADDLAAEFMDIARQTLDRETFAIIERAAKRNIMACKLI